MYKGQQFGKIIIIGMAIAYIQIGGVTMSIFQNIRIIDFTEKLAGPLAIMYLEKYGAEVIKVENPEKPDPSRNWEPVVDGTSLYFDYLNGGKKSLAADVSTEDGKNLVMKLIETADVVCVDKTDSQLKKLGIDYESVKAVKEDIIYAAVTPYGLKGLDTERPASSITVQAGGVAMDMTGMKGEEPICIGPSVMEHYAAGYLAAGIILALIGKKTAGEGQLVDISLQDSIFSCIEAAPSAYSTIGEIQSRKGNDDPSCAPYDSFETADGYFALGVATQRQWDKFCDALGYEDLKNDPRFNNDAGRLDDYMNCLRPILAERLLKLSRYDIEKACRDMRVPGCAVRNVAEVTDMPNTKENNFTECVNGITYPAMPFTLSDFAAKKLEAGPALGSDNETLKQEGGRP